MRLTLISLFAVLALLITAVAATTTIQALQHLQQQNTLANKGDVRTVRPWMTVPYIAHHYHVPENYLYLELRINKKKITPFEQRHLTLMRIATTNKQDVNKVIENTQQAIEEYHRQHPQRAKPTQIQTRLNAPGRQECRIDFGGDR